MESAGGGGEAGGGEGGGVGDAGFEMVVVPELTLEGIGLIGARSRKQKRPCDVGFPTLGAKKRGLQSGRERVD